MLKLLTFNPSEREGLQNLISLVFVVLLLLYVVFFLGDVYTLLRQKLKSFFPELAYLELLIKYGFIIVVPVLYVRAFVFGHDSLATSRDRYAHFFRSTLPSRFLLEAFNTTQGKANELWFRLFNIWRLPAHPRNWQWYATFRRTYTCRFIYLLQRWFYRGSFLFGLTLAIQEWYMWHTRGPFAIVDEGWFLKAGLTVGTLSIALFVSARNRIGDRPTGCWARLLEIEDGHKAWLAQEIVGPSNGNFDAAWAIAADLEHTWSPAPTPPAA